MRTSIATVCLSGTLDRQAARHRGSRIRRRRDLRARPRGLAGQPRGDRRSGPPARALARPLPTVPRRRRGRQGVFPGSCTGPGEVPAHAATRHRHHARLQQRRHRDRRRRRRLGRSASPPRRQAGPTACGWPTKRWPGAASSTTTGAPGESSSWPTTRRRRLPRQLPHPVARTRPCRDRTDPGREDLLPPARGRPGADDGRAVLESRTTGFSRGGHLRPRRLRRPRPAGRVHRTDVARGLQRHVPADRVVRTAQQAGARSPGSRTRWRGSPVACTDRPTGRAAGGRPARRVRLRRGQGGGRR